MINFKTKDWQIKNIETVLFDKDGTLIDLHYFWGKMTQMRSLAVIEKYNLKRKYMQQSSILTCQRSIFSVK